MNQIFQIHLERLFGGTTTISDVDRTEEEVFFSLPVDQIQDIPHGVCVMLWGIDEGKVKCSMNEISLEGQLALMDALKRVSHGPNRNDESCTNLNTNE